MENSGKLTAGTAGVAAWSALHPAVRVARGAMVAPSEKVRIALIGCGGMGNYDLDDFMRTRRFPWSRSATSISGTLTGPPDKVEKKYGKKPMTSADFHPILENKDIDAVIIGTPDHWHAIPFVYACMAGKDVYCEKPISHNIKEGRAMIDAARKYKRVSQIGTQQRSGEHFQKAVKLVQDGKLGRISMTRTWNFSNEAPEGCGKPADRDQAPNGRRLRPLAGSGSQAPVQPRPVSRHVSMVLRLRRRHDRRLECASSRHHPLGDGRDRPQVGSRRGRQVHARRHPRYARHPARDV